jgi:hypothetical protein
MSGNTYQALSEAFPVEMERTLTKSGVNLIYIPVSEVINRLNKVLGVDKWSFKIVRCERDASDPDFVVAHVRLEWTTAVGEDFNIVTRDGFGGQKIKRNKQGGIVDLGDEFKGAISDALKKAAQTLGVGLYLARSEDAIEIEQVIDAENGGTVQQVPAQNDELSQKWEEFVGLSKSLSADEKSQLNSYWESYSGGKPKPTKATADMKMLESLVAEIVRIKFNGTHIVTPE